MSLLEINAAAVHMEGAGGEDAAEEAGSAGPETASSSSSSFSSSATGVQAEGDRLPTRFSSDSYLLSTNNPAFANGPEPVGRIGSEEYAQLMRSGEEEEERRSSSGQLGVLYYPEPAEAPEETTTASVVAKWRKRAGQAAHVPRLAVVPEETALVSLPLSPEVRETRAREENTLPPSVGAAVPLARPARADPREPREKRRKIRGGSAHEPGTWERRRGSSLSSSSSEKSSSSGGSTSSSSSSGGSREGRRPGNRAVSGGPPAAEALQPAVGVCALPGIRGHIETTIRVCVCVCVRDKTPLLVKPSV